MFTTLIGVALGQSVSGAQLVGAALVIAGVLVTITANKQPAPATILTEEIHRS